ncbi:uncharacterized protein TNCV_52601 [Trichonephila clavipes]|nr:uncharacterized protein TNCV_52601 [Trichonephila clavipes]
MSLSIAPAIFRKLNKINTELSARLGDSSRSMWRFQLRSQQNRYLVEFMRNEFGLNYVQTSPTTLGNTTIDCTFTRNINVNIMPYVSYFTYHRPMLNKIVVEY